MSVYLCRDTYRCKAARTTSDTRSSRAIAVYVADRVAADEAVTA